jgi:hypothetical protein
MRPENYLKPLCLPFTADFFGLDRESQDALLVQRRTVPRWYARSRPVRGRPGLPVAEERGQSVPGPPDPRHGSVDLLRIKRRARRPRRPVRYAAGRRQGAGRYGTWIMITLPNSSAACYATDATRDSGSSATDPTRFAAPRTTSKAAFERMLRERSPRSIDGVEWAIYNQWVSEQRTARRLEQERRNLENR